MSLHITPHVHVHDMYQQTVLDVSRHSVIDVVVQVYKIMIFSLHLATCLYICTINVQWQSRWLNTVKMQSDFQANLNTEIYMHADYLKCKGMQCIAMSQYLVIVTNHTTNIFPEHLGSDLAIDYFHFLCKITCIVFIRLC